MTKLIVEIEIVIVTCVLQLPRVHLACRFSCIQIGYIHYAGGWRRGPNGADRHLRQQTREVAVWTNAITHFFYSGHSGEIRQIGLSITGVDASFSVGGEHKR